MKLNDFQRGVLRTLATDETRALRLTLALGLVTETNEMLAAADVYDEFRHSPYWAPPTPQERERSTIRRNTLRAALVSEIGDVLFYASGAAHEYGYPLSSCAGAESFEEFDGRAAVSLAQLFDPNCVTADLRHCVTLIGEQIKKEIAHKHPSEPEKLATRIGATLTALAVFGAMYQITLTEAAKENDRKLRARYPDGFATDRSLNKAE